MPGRQYSSLRTAIERTPGLNSLHLYGPVPIAVLKSVVPSLMMWKWKVPSTTGKSALGPASVMRTSLGPVALTSTIWSANDLAFEAVAGSL